jgi:hypothetical protein
MSESDIKKVTGPEWKANENDVHAAPRDPKTFNNLPAGH